MNDIERTELDATDLLMRDHREIESLLRDFAYLLANGGDATQIIADTCAELKMHDTLEHAIFYRALRDAADSEDIDAHLAEAQSEHDTILELIEKLENMPDVRQRNTCFAILSHHVSQHIASEEEQLFPLARLTPMDMQAVSSELRQRQTALMKEAAGIDAAVL